MPRELERYLHEHIPITNAMGVEVVRADELHVALRAPLEPNLNHRNTAFGGSIGAVATLAAWSWLHVRARTLDFPVRLVIRTSHVEFLAPIDDEFEAICKAPSYEAYAKYRDALHRHGRARIALDVRVCQGEKLCATFTGSFVALRGEEDGP